MIPRDTKSSRRFFLSKIQKKSDGDVYNDIRSHVEKKRNPASLLFLVKGNKKKKKKIENFENLKI